MKTDRELLGLAAKAADMDCVMTQPFIGLQIRGGNLWNPLTDDGDALRLAVDVRLNIHVWNEGRDVSVAKTLPDGENPPDDDTSAWFSENDRSGDIYIATRRAIVCAAAAIGEAMQ